MKTNLDSWFATNVGAIEGGLKRHAEDLSYFHGNNHKLPLSDLELCAAVDKRMVPIPPNFSVKQVDVKVGNSYWYTPHFIAVRGDEIVDYVPGIFFAEVSRQISGIAYISELAPQLLCCLSFEVAVLHTIASESKKLLRVEYIF